jgi:hypothetical protein
MLLPRFLLLQLSAVGFEFRLPIAGQAEGNIMTIKMANDKKRMRCVSSTMGAVHFDASAVLRLCGTLTCS